MTVVSTNGNHTVICLDKKSYIGLILSNVVCSRFYAERTRGHFYFIFN